MELKNVKYLMLVTAAVIIFSVALPKLASGQTAQPRMPEEMAEPDLESFEVWTNNRRILCSTHRNMELYLTVTHGEKRIMSAVPKKMENGPMAFLIYIGKESWTAVELIGRRACILSTGKLWRLGNPKDYPVQGDTL